MIDANCYAGPWPFRALPAAAPAEVARLLHADGVAFGLVSPLEGLFFEDPQVANERLACQLPADGSLWLCAVINPTLANWKGSLRHALGLGARAIKLHPNYHGYAADAPMALETLRAAGTAGIPVVVQLRMQDVRSQHPLCQVPDAPVEAALAAAAASPATRVVLGGVRYAEAAALAARIRGLPNVWLDLSQIEHPDGVRQLIAAIGCHRLLFGTHAPLFTVRSALLKLEEGLLDSEERAAVTHDNARRVLGERHILTP